MRFESRSISPYGAKSRTFGDNAIVNEAPTESRPHSSLPVSDGIRRTVIVLGVVGLEASETVALALEAVAHFGVQPIDGLPFDVDTNVVWEVLPTWTC